MSVLTEVLKLFKYDPATDGDMTFNIGQCMNDNWDKLDAALLLAIAAAGAYNPEESYAVGDYCTYKGKLHKCSTAIPTGETWTEAHWTTTTVAAELAELSSQLSNAAQSTLGQVPTADLLAWADAQPRTGAFGVEPTVTTEGVPAVGWYHGFLEIKQSGRRLTLTESSGQYRTWTNCTSSNQWAGWKPQALATPPQEFDLPLAEGITALQPCTYWKNQFGEVTIGGCTSGAVSDGSTIATLPEGYRPSRYVERPATFTEGGSRFAGSVFIDTAGIVTIHTPAEATNVVFAASFLAKN